MSNFFNPLISIVIPVYNGSNFLAQAINSALAQTYRNFEVLVVNDGSSDGGKTEEIALSYGDKIRYFEKPNGGVASALNLAIKNMKGEYFAWLSHDDEFMPCKLEKQIYYIRNSESRKDTVLFSDFIILDLFTNRQYKAQSLDERFLNCEPLYPWLFALFASPLHGCTSLIPKSCIDKIGLFDVNKRTTQDYDFFLRLLRAGFHFHFQNDQLVLNRQHSEQDSRKIVDIHLHDIHKFYLNAISLFSREFETIPLAKLKPFLSILQERKCPEAYRLLHGLWLAANPSQASSAAACAYPGPTRTFYSLAKNVVRRWFPASLRVWLRVYANKMGLY